MTQASTTAVHTLLLASDHAGYSLKAALQTALAARDLRLVDLGCDSAARSVDYPDYARKLTGRLAEAGNGVLGLLMCGSGVGMAMTANRIPGMRAVVCSEAYSAGMARAHNNANILCLGARVVGVDLALHIVDAFLSTPFEAGRHARRVAAIEG
ncbi:MAG: ribose 5-phosphate isomerase B [Polyangiales bacterium]